MQLPTVKIKEKATGRIKIVNQTKYSDDIASYVGWTIVSMRRGAASDLDVAMEREQERVETARQNNPKSPAFKDKQLAFESRSGFTINTSAETTDESPFGAELTTAVTETTLDPIVSETREVPVIGGSQTVKVRGRKPKSPQDEGDVL